MINPDQEIQAIAIQLEEYGIEEIEKLLQAIALYIKKHGDNAHSTTVQ